VRHSLSKNWLPTIVKGVQLLSVEVGKTCSGGTAQSVASDGAMRLGLGKIHQCKPASVEGCAYQLLGVSQSREIYLGRAASNPFRNAGHVVASDSGTGRALVAANNPFFRNKRETKLVKANLGVANALEDEFLVSRNGEFSGRRHTGINTARNAQVLTFVGVSRVVVLVRPVRCTESTLGCRQSR